MALATPKVSQAFRQNRIIYLKADWTRRDPVIAADLARFGRAGVPLYLMYPAGGGEPAILPSILTEGMVLKALAAARGSGRIAAGEAKSGAVTGA